MRRSLLFVYLIIAVTLLAPTVVDATSSDGIFNVSPIYAQGGDDDGVRPLDDGGDEGDDGGGIVERIKKTVTNITQIVIPSRTMFDAINNVLARATSGQLNDASGAYNQLAGAATGMIQEQLFPTEELMDISSSTLPLAAALAVPLFLLRLAIYHWRQLVGGDDTAAAAVGDWIIAGGWAYIAGHLVTFVLKLSVDLATAAFGSVPQLVGDFMFNLSPAEAGAGLIANLVGAGFMGSIVFFVAGLGLVAAAIAVMWAFAVASGLSFILAATGPVAGVVGVVPQMRWLRSLWLKAVVLLAIFPLGAGAVFKAAGLLPTMAIAGPIGAVIRLMWIWGAVGFLFAVAGIAGRFSIGSGAAVGMGMVKAGKAVVDLGATASVTGGVGVGAVGAGGAVAGAGTAAMRGSSGGAGLLGSGSSDSGSGVSGGASAGTESAADPTSRAGAGASSQAPGDPHRQAAAQSLGRASTQQRAAGATRALGLNRLSNLFRDQSQQAQIEARRHELAARREEYLSRQRGDDGGDRDSRDNAGGPPPPSSGGGGAGTGPGSRPRSGQRDDSGGASGSGSSQSGSSQPARRGQAGTYSPATSSGTGASSTSRGRGDAGDSEQTRSSARQSAPQSGAVSAPSSVGTRAVRRQYGAQRASSEDATPPPQQSGTQAGTGQGGIADSLSGFSLSRPVRQEFASGYRDAGGSETAARPAVEQLHDDLTAVSGDDSTFHRFAGAGDDARDLGRLAAAYQHQQGAMPDAPAARLRQAYHAAYGDDASARERDVPGALGDTLGVEWHATNDNEEDTRS